jgi:hypothetical protein
MKRKLIINYGSDYCKVAQGETNINVYVSADFDVVESEDLISRIQKIDFQIVEISIPIDHGVFKHICVFISLLDKDVQVRAWNNEANDYVDITENINNIKLDFGQHQLKYQNLTDVFSRSLLIEVTKPYIEKFAAANFDLSQRERPQSDVEELFNRVGLAHDLVMRD